MGQSRDGLRPDFLVLYVLVAMLKIRAVHLRQSQNDTNQCNTLGLQFQKFYAHAHVVLAVRAS